MAKLITHSIWQRLGNKGKYVAFQDGASLNSAVRGKHVSIEVSDMSDILARQEIPTQAKEFYDRVYMRVMADPCSWTAANLVKWLRRM